MSETGLSYEELVKELKPFDIIVEKLSDEQLANLKVVNDPNLIKDEVIVTEDKPEEDEEEEEVEDEEIEVDLNEAEMTAKNNTKEDLRQYICFMCKRPMNGYNESLIHYQLHIDYYPIQCSECDEALTDMLSFVNHCRRAHPEFKRAKYIKKDNSVYFDWIHNLLTTDPNPSALVVHKYCPVCDWTHLISQTDEKSPKAIPIISHIHEHIQYMPFECIKCRRDGKQFRIHYTANNVTKPHITSEHKEFEPPYWKHFSHKYSIPSLDKFVSNYLHILGIKSPKRRNKKKKQKPIATEVNGQISQPIVATNVSVNNQIAIQPKSVAITMNSSEISVQNMLPNINLLQPINQMISTQIISQTLSNGNSVITYSRPNPSLNYSGIIVQRNPLQMTNPLLILPSNDKINFKPTYVESTDINVVCVDPKIIEIEDNLLKYICIFCEEEKVFESKLEMCVHYSIHFSYYPIICMLCEKSFLDLSTLIYHYNKTHCDYKNNLFHYLKEDQKIEKWINSFVSYQKTHEFKGNVSVAFGDFCFVCQKLAKNKTSFQLNCNKDNTKAIRDHINQHLHYFPFKCLICFHGNRNVRFTSFNTSAVIHMNKIHNINTTEMSAKSLSKLIGKTDEILDLEKFIDKQMFPKKEKTSETTITLNLKRKLEEIEIESKKRFDSYRLSSTNSLPALPSAQVLPMIRHENRDNNRQIQTLLEKPVSLLKFSTTSSPQKQMNGINISKVTAPTLNTIEYIPNRVTYIEPYLVCFHCHTRVANTKELESHHQSKHPKLTIASYAPTRRDLLANH